MRRIVGVTEISVKVDRIFSKSMEDVERMSENRPSKAVSESDVLSRRFKGRSCPKWLDGVKNTCSAKLAQLTDIKIMCKD